MTAAPDLADQDTIELKTLVPRNQPRHRHNTQRRRSRRRRVVLTSVIVAGVLLGTTAVGGYLLMSRLPGNVNRIGGAFDGLDEQDRPTVSTEAKGSLNFVLVGSDSRDDEPTTGSDAANATFRPGAQRSDVMMLMHLAADRKQISIISLPRDSWVNIPGRGMGKLNWAYSYGGPPLLIRTLEQITGVRIDHFAAIDFYGFKAVVDAIGGVDVQVSSATTSAGTHFRKGLNHLNGTQALAYVRQRHELPQGDLDRVKRQQNLIRAIMTKTASMNPAENPVKLYRLLDAATRSISVDEQLSDGEMRSLALSAAGVSGSGVAFLTSPVRGTGMEGDQSVVHLDDTRCTELWTAVRDDAMPDYLTTHAKDLLPSVPR